MGVIKALIVDSNISYINEIKSYFNNSNSIDICFDASNGEDGLEIIKNHRDEFDVIIIDLLLPLKDGIEVLEEVKRLNINKKIIVDTSCNSNDMIRKVSELGIDYFILKPFLISSLENKILKCFNNNESKIINIYHNNIQIYLTRILHELGVPSNIKGYQYIKECILLVYENPKYSYGITKELYPCIADMFSTTVSCVERSIRHAIDLGWNRGNMQIIEDFFGYSIDLEKCKPTNSEFIITIADKLRMVYYENTEV